ncbi:MAG: HAMP domain-containing protein, partial [bacterium]
MRSIRWKIIIVCIAVLAVPIFMLSRNTTRTFDEFTRRNLEQQMIDMAFVVGEQFKFMIRTDGSLHDKQRSELTALIASYSRQTESRIGILSSNRVVLVDSDSSSTTSAALSSLPEVSAALTGKYKARYALTPDRKFMFYYIAVPIMLNDRVIGVTSVSRHTNPIVKTIGQMVHYRQIATATAVILGIVLATILAYTITSRLRKLTAATKAFARGEAPLKVEVRGNDEIAELAHAINTMADEIAHTNRYNRDFVSAVMHELRMPITAIKGAAELLEQGAF